MAPAPTNRIFLAMRSSPVVRAAGRRGAGAPPAEARLQILVRVSGIIARQGVRGDGQIKRNCAPFSRSLESPGRSVAPATLKRRGGDLPARPRDARVPS